MELNKFLLSLFICLQAISTVVLWSLNSTEVASQAKFTIFLAIDLVCFAMVAYSYRKLSWGLLISSAWILVGSFGLVVLFFSAVLFP